MATTLLPGQRSWGGGRDDEGWREYFVRHIVKAAATDGPANVLRTAGLPLPGSMWSFGNDLDPWVWCRPGSTLSILDEKDGDPSKYWIVEQKFSNKPPGRNRKSCQENTTEDPLLEPAKVSGKFVKYAEEATHDLFGRPILNSAWEQLRGPQVEFDRNRPQVRIEQNVASLGLELASSMVDTVNQFPLWGLPPRTIKLSDFDWDQKYHGQCYRYYTRVFVFDVMYETFDRTLLDEGTKVLSGHWDDATGTWALDNVGGAAPNRMNPTHFIRMADKKGDSMRVVLNGYGEPATDKIVSVTKYTDSAVLRPGKRIPPSQSGTAGFSEPGGLAAALKAGGNLGVGTTASYQVTATSGKGETLPSAAAEATPTSANRSIEITWSEITDTTCTGYNIYRKRVGVDAAYLLVGNVRNALARTPGQVSVVKYSESNFLLLGIPITL